MLLVVLLVVIGVGLLGLRYGPAVADVRAVRNAASRLSAQAKRLKIEDFDRVAVAGLQATVDELDADLNPLRDLINDDPLVGLLRGAPLVGAQVQAGAALVAAADSLVEASDLGLALAGRVATLREENDEDPSVALLPGLVELMATSVADVDRIGALIEDANSELDRISPDALGPLQDARDLVAEPLQTYSPLLESYREAAAVLPGILGWGDEKRYLVLAQNPAELRPTGGYSGTVGIIAFRDGAIVEQGFGDVHLLDRTEGLPFVEAPAALVNHLLGNEQSWRLADANWSPDFPTSAQQALAFYEMETGDGDIDGVIAITTFALDRLLEVLGPVTLDDFDTTVEAGNATFVLLDSTRGGVKVGRKAILGDLAREITRRLLQLPPDRWVPMLAAVQDIGDEHMALTWFKEEAAQQFVSDAGWAGPVRQDIGDYLYIVESNVAPTSKYNLVVDRSRSLVVKLDDGGDALTSVRLDWQNDAGKSGQPYDALRDFSVNQEGWYGAYVRALVPRGSELIAVNGRAADDIRGAESVSEEAGRAVFANYLLMPPGEATLTYLWSTPGAAVRSGSGDAWEYRLLLQKQPGARPEAVSVRIDLPKGATVLDASAGATINGDRVGFGATMITDTELLVRYELARDDA